MSDTRKSAENKGRILIVDDEPDMVSGLRQYLRRLSFDAETAGDAETALQLLRLESYDLVLTDLMLPAKSGIELLEEIKANWPDIFVILFTGFATVETAVQAIRSGAFDYIPKPFTPQQLEIVINRAFKHKALAEENQSLRDQIQHKFSFESLIGRSLAMKKIHGLLARVAKTDASVLIYGESGTGKELIARALHANSRRRNKPFVPLDCAALPFNLLESELFGYERGAFTGANASHSGLLEAAHHGAFFMDEIGELDPSIQVKLLRVLQERQFRRVGGSKIITVDVRFVAATNRELKKEVEAGRFREDLFHRLNVIQITLPPLRDREGDIPLLANHFLQVQGKRLGKSGLQLTPAAMKAFESFTWPGNVRELQNAIEYGISLSEGPYIGIDDLPNTIQDHAQEWDGKEATSPHDAQERDAISPPRVHHELPYKLAKRRWLETFEQEYFTELLRRHDFNISHAARAARIDRKSIQRILKKNNLDIGQIVEEE